MHAAQLALNEQPPKPNANPVNVCDTVQNPAQYPDLPLRQPTLGSEAPVAVGAPQYSSDIQASPSDQPYSLATHTAWLAHLREINRQDPDNGLNAEKKKVIAELNTWVLRMNEENKKFHTELVGLFAEDVDMDELVIKLQVSSDRMKKILSDFRSRYKLLDASMSTEDDEDMSTESNDAATLGSED